jgi:acylphosphatase
VVATARWLGLRGWVRNRKDGTVEMLVTGDSDRVAAMIDQCRDGPPASHVAEIAVVEAQDDGSAGFAPRPTT